MTMRNALPTPRAFLFIFGILVVITVAISTGHCTPTKVHTNSLGVTMYQDNPNAYLEGAILGGSIVGSGHNIGTNLRLQPSHTYSLFTQELLICGGPSEELAKASIGGPLVLTYEVQAHRMVNGIGCHDLVGIDVVAAKPGL